MTRDQLILWVLSTPCAYYIPAEQMLLCASCFHRRTLRPITTLPVWDEALDLIAGMDEGTHACDHCQSVLGAKPIENEGEARVH